MGLQLRTTIQGIRGGQNKNTDCGYSLLTAGKNGQGKVQISIDTFDGFGHDYKERENLHIEIYFPGFETWEGTPEELREILNPKKP